MSKNHATEIMLSFLKKSCPFYQYSKSREETDQIPFGQLLQRLCLCLRMLHRKVPNLKYFLFLVIKDNPAICTVLILLSNLKFRVDRNLAILYQLIEAPQDVLFDDNLATASNYKGEISRRIYRHGAPYLS